MTSEPRREEASEDPRMTQRDEPDLLRRCREGDADAFDELFRHHYAGAVRYAARVSPALDPEDLTAEAFARIWATIRGGGGPDHAFGQYLRTTIRNLAVNTATRGHEEPADDDRLDHWMRREAQVADDGFSSAMAEHAVVAKAFETLPQRWRSVLWMIDVEGLRTSDVARRLGLSANGAAALTKRARAALSQAWLTAHVDTRSTRPECVWVLDHVSGYARGTLSEAQRERVRRHLDECDSCNRAAHRIGHLATSLRVVAIVAGGSLVGLVDARRRRRLAGLSTAAAVVAVVAFAAGADSSPPRPGVASDGPRPRLPRCHRRPPVQRRAGPEQHAHQPSHRADGGPGRPWHRADGDGRRHSGGDGGPVRRAHRSPVRRAHSGPVRGARDAAEHATAHADAHLGAGPARAPRGPGPNPEHPAKPGPRRSGSASQPAGSARTRPGRSGPGLPDAVRHAVVDHGPPAAVAGDGHPDARGHTRAVGRGDGDTRLTGHPRKNHGAASYPAAGRVSLCEAALRGAVSGDAAGGGCDFLGCPLGQPRLSAPGGCAQRLTSWGGGGLAGPGLCQLRAKAVSGFPAGDICRVRRSGPSSVHGRPQPGRAGRGRRRRSGTATRDRTARPPR